MALWSEETKRNIVRLQSAIETVWGRSDLRCGRNVRPLSPKVEEYVCAKLGLKSDPVSTQVIQRDRHAEYLTTLAVIGSSLDKFATEIRHLQRTEVLEAEEYFSEAKRGVGNAA